MRRRSALSRSYSYLAPWSVSWCDLHSAEGAPAFLVSSFDFLSTFIVDCFNSFEDDETGKLSPGNLSTAASLGIIALIAISFQPEVINQIILLCYIHI